MSKIEQGLGQYDILSSEGIGTFIYDGSKIGLWWSKGWGTAIIITNYFSSKCRCIENTTSMNLHNYISYYCTNYINYNTCNISIEPLSLVIKTRTGNRSISIFFNVDAATLPKCLVIMFTARVLFDEKVTSHPKVTKFSFRKPHTESEHRDWVQKTLVKTELSWCKYKANIFLWKEEIKNHTKKSAEKIRI